MKEKINKDMKTPKNNQSKLNNSISQINITLKAWQTEWSKLKIEYQEQKTK
jgi:predicted  nucleic acid-binding Zn-ribbon protein